MTDQIASQASVASLQQSPSAGSLRPSSRANSIGVANGVSYQVLLGQVNTARKKVKDLTAVVISKTADIENKTLLKEKMDEQAKKINGELRSGLMGKDKAAEALQMDVMKLKRWLEDMDNEMKQCAHRELEIDMLMGSRKDKNDDANFKTKEMRKKMQLVAEKEKKVQQQVKYNNHLQATLLNLLEFRRKLAAQEDIEVKRQLQSQRTRVHNLGHEVKKAEEDLEAKEVDLRESERLILEKVQVNEYQLKGQRQRVEEQVRDAQLELDFTNRELEVLHDELEADHLELTRVTEELTKLLDKSKKNRFRKQARKDGIQAAQELSKLANIEELTSVKDAQKELQNKERELQDNIGRRSPGGGPPSGVFRI